MSVRNENPDYFISAADYGIIKTLNLAYMEKPRGQLIVYAVLAGLVLFLAAASPSLAAGASPDAIAIRVVPNSSHQSPLEWYKANVKLQGSPQNLNVDGYEAVRDGRTVYVNAANVSGSKLYTNIYIISYNQEAETRTIDIFGQLLAHWKFNVNVLTGEKDKVRNDTRRLSGLARIKAALEKYKEKQGRYPVLSAGSYQAGKTISVWPSWQATLGADLSANLPLDPINKLGPCPALGYDAQTCWNQVEKKFAGSLPGGLPAGSRVFVYSTDPAGASYVLCADYETAFINESGFAACSGQQ